MNWKSEGKKLKQFLWKNRYTFVQLGVIGGCVALLGDTSFASSADKAGAGFETITGPLNTLKSTMSGPIATGVATTGAVVFGLATATNMENQLVKRAIQFTGGAAGGLGAASIINDLGGGLLFL